MGKKNNGNGDDQQKPEVPKDIQEHLEDIDRKIWEEELKDEG